MDIPYRFLAYLLILAFVLFLLARKVGTWAKPPYHRGRFLSENEKSFFRVIKLAAGHNYHVFAQVRLADLVQIKAGLNDHGRRKALYSVASKSIDFVLVSASSLDPILAIEVDDRSHFRSDRQIRDVFVNEVFKEIGVPLLRVRAQMTYDVAEIQGLLTAHGIMVKTYGVAKHARLS
jgi:hypothetical protein